MLESYTGAAILLLIATGIAVGMVVATLDFRSQT